MPLSRRPTICKERDAMPRVSTNSMIIMKEGKCCSAGKLIFNLTNLTNLQSFMNTASAEPSPGLKGRRSLADN